MGNVKEMFTNKTMIALAVTLLGMVFLDTYIDEKIAEKNDLSNPNETSQIETINK